MVEHDKHMCKLDTIKSEYTRKTLFISFFILDAFSFHLMKELE